MMFLGIYYETLDHTGHHNGPYSQEMKIAVRDLDIGITYLLDKLETAGLTDQVNTVIKCLTLY